MKLVWILDLVQYKAELNGRVGIQSIAVIGDDPQGRNKREIRAWSDMNAVTSGMQTWGYAATEFDGNIVVMNAQEWQEKIRRGECYKKSRLDLGVDDFQGERGLNKVKM